MNLYDIICGHSMGGGLLMKYCSEHPKMEECKVQGLIFMMPLIYKVDYINTIIQYIPDWIQLPKALIIPNNYLYEDGNILNDTYGLIPVKQIIQMYNYMDDLNLGLLNKENYSLIYTNDEKLTTIPKNILDLIKNIHFVNGNHMCFNEPKNSRQFFEKFVSLLDPKYVSVYSPEKGYTDKE
jgi:pimeloyl-ACP methyl ester carboxylesterase